jgi:Protein of unknown function (DUF3592)
MKRKTAPSMPLRTLVFRVLAIIAGLASLVIGYQERSRISHLRETGLSAVVEPIVDYTERSRRGSKTYSANFIFTTDKGQRIEQRHTFPGELLTDFENGTPVTVRYDPSSPSDFMFDAEESPLLPYLMGIGFIVAAFVFIRAPKE